ncbi:hypothetical protein [Paenibacillus sp. N3.4]|uniref:hypothetical protein n=1 Tax=Paenibacillus sp. N3.4 TaxID=2603222 RepID=UPI0011CAC4CC|nr:hypothetical protein [Paenibacillus sp. N3.4]TXK77492.1 hypothetical protein FU659_22800 [Paenibacillus sp. N3.4]
MFIKLFSKIYLKFSSFKQNIKTLPGDHNTFDENWVATIRLDIGNVGLFFNNVASLIENGFEDTEIIAVTAMISELKKREEQQMHFNIFYNGELTGFTIMIYMLASSRIELNFVTDKELAEQIQVLAELYENPPNSTKH